MQGIEWIILILVGVFLLLGAKKVPEFAKALGRAKGEFAKGKKEVLKEVEKMDDDDDDYEPRKRKKGKKGSKVRTAAEDLGIDTEGKTDAELRKEIKKSLS